MISTSWKSYYKYKDVTRMKKKKKYDKIAHSPGAAVEGVREATSSFPGSKIFKETTTHLSTLSHLSNAFQQTKQ